MAPKKVMSTFGSLVIPETINFIAICSEIEANGRYKCFVKFIADSYLQGALFAKPTLYVNVLEQFWKSVTCEDVALVNGEENTIIACTIGTIFMYFDDMDINKALTLLEKNFQEPTTDAKLVDFLDFIHYFTIDLTRLNKKFMHRELSYVFDTMLKVFTGRKTGWITSLI